MTVTTGEKEVNAALVLLLDFLFDENAAEAAKIKIQSKI